MKKCCKCDNPAQAGYYCKRHRQIYHLRNKFNITTEEVEDLISITNCEICDVELVRGIRGHKHNACVDHCHETGNIRGVLCDTCNKLLGYAKDDVGVLAEAIKYLTKS